MSNDKVIKQIKFEIDQIDKLLESYHKLFRMSEITEPDLIEITALASVIHSFYNGVENIFQTIAKKVDRDVPDTGQWHRDLLKQMSKITDQREAVISNELMAQLAVYLGFRHFYRHSYSYMLKWDELKDLVINLESIWENLKKSLHQFLKNQNKAL
jgi:hypothetical protein